MARLNKCEGFGLHPIKVHWQSLPSADIGHICCAEEDDGVSGGASCQSGAEAVAIKFENGEACYDAPVLGSAIQSPKGLGELEALGPEGLVRSG